VILPSLNDVKDIVLIAKSWLKKSKPFLMSASSSAPDSSSLLEVKTLKVLALSRILVLCLKLNCVCDDVLYIL
jgi:hypothetical protein